MNPTKSLRRRRFAAGTLALGAGLMAFGYLAPTASASLVEPEAYTDNPACPEGYVEFKIDNINELPANGPYTEATQDVEIKPEDTVLPAGFTIELANVTGGDNASFDWSAYDDNGGFPIDIVFVKASNAGNKYVYPAPGATSDTGLVSPKGSISHISFCFDFEVPSDDGGTDDGTTDDGTTDDGTTDDGTTDDGTTDDGTTDDGTTDDGTTDDGTTDDGTTDDGTTDDGTTDDGTTDDGTTDDVGATTGETDDGTTDDTTPATVAGRTVTRPTVAGAVVTRAALPATGAEDHSLMVLGGALVLAGLASLLMSREVLNRA